MMKENLTTTPTFAILQARMGSLRLPGKVLKEICGQPILWHIIERVKQAKKIDEIIVATTEEKEDDPIEDYVKSMGIRCFRGSAENVLDRFFYAAVFYHAEIIVRLTADNPLVDPQILDQLIYYFDGCGFSYASTSGYPLGLGAEVFSFGALDEAYVKANKAYEKEHVTPYMYRDISKVGKLVSNKDLSYIRLTVDTPEDFEFVTCIYHALYHGKHDFNLNEILGFLENHPNIMTINQHIHQKKLGE